MARRLLMAFRTSESHLGMLIVVVYLTKVLNIHYIEYNRIEELYFRHIKYGP